MNTAINIDKKEAFRPQLLKGANNRKSEKKKTPTDFLFQKLGTKTYAFTVVGRDVYWGDIKL